MAVRALFDDTHAAEWIRYDVSSAAEHTVPFAAVVEHTVQPHTVSNDTLPSRIGCH